MDVRCPKCDTLYEIDARQLRGGGATLKCSQCEYVFRLESHASLSQENQRRWMVKNTSSGDILYFTSFNELHQWILQGNVSKADEVSRTGKKWKRLGDVGEFMPIFQAVESISSISASHAAERRAADEQASSEPKPKPQSSETGSEFRSKVKTSNQFALDVSKPAPTQEAASAERSSPPGPTSPGPKSPAPKSPRSKSPLPKSPNRKRPGPEPPRAQSPAPQRSMPQEAPRPSTQSQSSGTPPPQVRLQTGAFGAADTKPAPGADDDWSFGAGSSLGELEGTGRHNAVELESKSSRWPIVALVMVLVVGGGAAVYFARPDLIDTLLASTEDTEVVDLAKSEKMAGEPESQEEKSPRGRLEAAVADAMVSAERENAKHLAAGIVAARPKVESSVDEALAAATKAAEEPDADELLAKAKRYLESGRPRRARKKFHEVLELERTNVEAVTGLGWSLLASGRPAAASAQFRKALSFNAGYGDAYIGLGKAEREQGNHKAALDAYQSYLNRFPGGSKASIASYQAEKLEQTLGQ